MESKDWERRTKLQNNIKKGDYESLKDFLENNYNYYRPGDMKQMRKDLHTLKWLDIVNINHWAEWGCYFTTITLWVYNPGPKEKIDPLAQCTKEVQLEWG